MRLPLPVRLLCSPSRWTLALECMAALGFAWIGLKILKLPTLSAMGCRLFTTLVVSPATEPSERHARELAHSVRQACVFLPGMLCLQQALAAQWLIARHGGSCAVHVGVANRAGVFRSHAWASYGGRILIGGAAAEEEYREILRVPSPDRLPSPMRNRKMRGVSP